MARLSNLLKATELIRMGACGGNMEAEFISFGYVVRAERRLSTLDTFGTLQFVSLWLLNYPLGGLTLHSPVT